MLSKIYKYGLVASIIIFFSKLKNSIINSSYKRRFGIKNISIGPGGFISNSSRIYFSDNFYAGTNLWIENVKNKGIIVIGSNCRLSNNVHIACINRITIGKGVLIGSNVLITDHSHGKLVAEEKFISPYERTLFSKGEVIIGDNVWICDGVMILPGVTIGSGAIIAANSVVVSNIPSFTVAAGTPAKVIKCIGA